MKTLHIVKHGVVQYSSSNDLTKDTPDLIAFLTNKAVFVIRSEKNEQDLFVPETNEIHVIPIQHDTTIETVFKNIIHIKSPQNETYFKVKDTEYMDWFNMLKKVARGGFSHLLIHVNSNLCNEKYSIIMDKNGIETVGMGVFNFIVSSFEPSSIESAPRNITVQNTSEQEQVSDSHLQDIKPPVHNSVTDPEYPKYLTYKERADGLYLEYKMKKEEEEVVKSVLKMSLEDDVIDAMQKNIQENFEHDSTIKKKDEWVFELDEKDLDDNWEFELEEEEEESDDETTTKGTDMIYFVGNNDERMLIGEAKFSDDEL
jgi:hypothetical protein